MELYGNIYLMLKVGIRELCNCNVRILIVIPILALRNQAMLMYLVLDPDRN